jgi:hypothetical protein
MREETLEKVTVRLGYNYNNTIESNNTIIQRGNSKYVVYTL